MCSIVGMNFNGTSQTTWVYSCEEFKVDKCINCELTLKEDEVGGNYVFVLRGRRYDGLKESKFDENTIIFNGGVINCINLGNLNPIVGVILSWDATT